MKTKPLPTRKYLLECFNYDSENGLLIPKHRPRGHFKSEVGFKISKTKDLNSKISLSTTGYLITRINGTSYMVHRLIWKIETDCDPVDEIDHIDCNRLNNQISNLREATSTENNRNVSLRNDNKTGFKGVHFEKSRGRYQAKIRIGTKRLFLGYFNSAEEASAAYNKAALIHHKEFARTNPS